MLANSSHQTTKIGLVQIGELTWERRRRQQWVMKNGLPVLKPSYSLPGSFVYLPYSVGLLQSYVQKHAQHPQQYQFLMPIYSPMAVSEAVQQLQGAQVVGFSAYIWNIRLSLAIARALKEQNPKTLIVFGGPQVPDHAQDFLRENRFIDIVCHGEGEKVFLQILENSAAKAWDEIESVSYLTEDDQFVTHPKMTRTKDLTVIPSPYLDGVFDELIKNNPQHNWLVMWETNRGCPFSCTFCDWGSAVASKVSTFDMERLIAEVDWFAKNKIGHVFICDANFGIFPRDIEIARYMVDTYKKSRYPSFVSIQNSKNQTDRTYTIQKIFSEMMSAGVTLSLQSVDATTLKNIKRDNISLNSFFELQRRYKQDGIPTYTDILIGLPGETYDSFANGLSSLIKNGQHNRVAFYNTTILPNAEMGNPEYQKKFGMVSVLVPIIHHHDDVETREKQEVKEYIDTVITTNSMPKADWVKTKCFAWMAEFLHFDRLLQIVMILMAEAYEVPYRELFEAFLNAKDDKYPIFKKINERFIARAQANQLGEPEYVKDERWLNIWWPIHHHTLIWLATENKIEAFYAEIEQILVDLLMSREALFEPELVHDAVTLNRQLVRLPFVFSNLELELGFNVWEYYQGILLGQNVALEKKSASYVIDRTSTVWITWESWYEDVIMRLNGRQNQLYTIKPTSPAKDLHISSSTQSAIATAD